MTSAFISIKVEEVKQMSSGSGKEYYLVSGRTGNDAWVRFPLFGNHSKYGEDIKPGDKLFVVCSVDYSKTRDGRKRFLVNPLEIYKNKEGFDINDVVYVGRVTHSGVAEDGRGYAYIATGLTSSSLVRFESTPPEKDSYVYVVCELTPKGQFSFDVVAKHTRKLSSFWKEPVKKANEGGNTKSAEQSDEQIEVPF